MTTAASPSAQTRGERRRPSAAAPPELRAAMVIDSFRPVLGGAQLQIERLAPLLAARGVRATVLTRRTTRSTPRHAREGTLDVVRVPAPGPASTASLGYAIGGAAWLSRWPPQVVHVHGLLSACTLALGGTAFSHTPVIVKLLSSGPHGDLARLRTKPGGDRRWRWILRRAAAFVCVSGQIADDLRAEGVDEARIVRIPNGVDLDHHRPRGAKDGPAAWLRAARGLPAAGPLILTAGRLDPRKRLDRVIAAHAAVPGTLLIIGEGPDRARLERTAVDAGLAERVIFHPTVDDLAPFLRAADVYVTCSDQDGLSNAVLEAMASGIPVVASRAGGMAELVDETTGVLLPEATPEALGEALNGLVKDPQRASDLGRGGRARCVARYGLDTTADRLTELYRTLTKLG